MKLKYDASYRLLRSCLNLLQVSLKYSQWNVIQYFVKYKKNADVAFIQDLKQARVACVNIIIVTIQHSCVDATNLGEKNSMYSPKACAL